ncbi:unnamed protein product [Phyllotreta striolata]|uniref:Uncharacterized protein n=1 Tax=Phyllotreta striolata TaxID=444603 RepID=A0A9N9TE33_PHYSR|nr:unnamed protein product [Phyllotreta striolata]
MSDEEVQTKKGRKTATEAAKRTKKDAKAEADEAPPVKRGRGRPKGTSKKAEKPEKTEKKAPKAKANGVGRRGRKKKEEKEESAEEENGDQSSPNEDEEEDDE